MPTRTYRGLLFALAAVGLTADLSSKYGVFRWLYDPETFVGTREVVPGWFRLIAQYDPSVPPCDCALNGLQTWSAPHMPRVNHGALFGMGGSQRGSANGFFAGVSALAALAIVVWGTRRSTVTDRTLAAALGLILGGTVGNLYDRLVFGGVRDFLYFYYIEWPVFNVADCCLVVGAGLLLLQAFLTPQPQPSPPDAAT